MKSIVEILSEGPFTRDQGRELLELVEAHLQAGAAAWLIECIKPMQAELKQDIEQAEAKFKELDTSVKAFEAVAGQATANRNAAGANPPYQLVEAQIKANQQLSARQQARRSAQNDLQEAQRRLKHIQDILEALRGEQGPKAEEVQRVVRLILSSPARLVRTR